MESVSEGFGDDPSCEETLDTEPAGDCCGCEWLDDEPGMTS